MIRRPPRSTLLASSAASDVYKRQHSTWVCKLCLFLSLFNLCNLFYLIIKWKENGKSGKQINFGMFGAKERGNPFDACQAGDTDRTERLGGFFHQRYFTFAWESKRLGGRFGRLLSFCHRIHQMNRSFLLRLHVRWIWKCRTAWRRSGRSPGFRWCIRPGRRPVLQYLYTNTPLPILSCSMYMSGKRGICSGPGAPAKMKQIWIPLFLYLISFLKFACKIRP